MQLKTILNRVQKHRSFVYGPARLVDRSGLAIEVEVRARANARARCSCCGCPGAGYDTLPARHFEFVPLWGIRVFLVYAMRRVACMRCGVRVEAVPWAQGKHQLIIRAPGYKPSPAAPAPSDARQFVRADPKRSQGRP